MHAVSAALYHQHSLTASAVEEQTLACVTGMKHGDEGLAEISLPAGTCALSGATSACCTTLPAALP